MEALGPFTAVELKDCPVHSMSTPFQSIPLLNGAWLAPGRGRRRHRPRHLWLHEALNDMKFLSDTGVEVELGKGALFWTKGYDFLPFIGFEMKWDGKEAKRA